MSVNVLTISTPKKRPPKISDERFLYPEINESIMPEGILHFLLSVNLTSTLLAFFVNRQDAKVFGNCMLYYEEGNPKKVVSPDLMICFGLDKTPPRVYKLWEEKVVPSVVIELASETTWLNDVSTKLALYQKLGVQEYYIFDVEYNNLPDALLAYRLIEDELVQIEIKEKRILSESLDLKLVDTGETLRFFNPKTNEFLMTTEEMAAELARLKTKNQSGK